MTFAHMMEIATGMVVLLFLTGITFPPGKSSTITFTPSGGAAQTIYFQESNWDEEIDDDDVTHSGSSGVQSLIACILRGSGAIQFRFDSDNVYCNGTIQITAGTNGVITRTMSSGKAHSIPVMIKSVGNAIAVNGGIKINAAVKLNGLAGSYTRPS